MTTQIPYTAEVRPDTGVYNAKLGIWLFLASEVMLFGALFSAYILLRVGADPANWPHSLLNIPIGTFNTAVLITSSVTVVLSWAALKMGNFARYRKLQAITLICAVGFLGIKSFEYREKFSHYEVWLKDGTRYLGHIEHQGKSPAFWKTATLSAFVPAHSTYFAVYFTLTALHALHVLGGALVIGYLWGPGARMWQTEPERYTNRVETSGLFWHFVDLVWIFLFPVLYLL